MRIDSERFPWRVVGRFVALLALAAFLGAAPPEEGGLEGDDAPRPKPAEKKPADKKPVDPKQDDGLEGDDKPKKPGDPKAPAVESRFDRIVKDLWDPDEKIRDFGIRAMFDLEKRNDIDIETARKALALAFKPYPYDKPPGWRVQSVLVGVCEHPPRTELIPDLVRIFGKLQSDAQGVVLLILGKMQEKEAAEAYLQLLRTHVPDGKLDRLFLVMFGNELRHPDVFFPAIFELTKYPKVRREIWSFSDRYFANKLIPKDKLPPYADNLIASFRDARAELAKAEKAKAENNPRGSVYYEREYCRQLLDLMTFFPMDKMEPVLREALEDKDLKVKMAAALTLIFKSKEVEPKYLEEVAASPEMRTNLYQNLVEVNMNHLFPKKYLNQKAIAEGDLARRLVIPGQLWQMPDEMELMKVVPIDTGLKDGVYDIYVFRFKVNPPHDMADKGWMVGFSGPFPQKGEWPLPLGPASGTRLDVYDGQTPEQHLRVLGSTEQLKAGLRQYHEWRTAEK